TCPPIRPPNPFISTALTLSLYSPSGWPLSDAHETSRRCDRIRPQRAHVGHFDFMLRPHTAANILHKHEMA
ncbi:hypothetical protein AB9K34_16775, partial [Sedimentitalea sp. XS_ASV28]|uniref:hypothetical protein n=1 Tax=Sedimentitalea sp. XS_ASV28 TaxID=3241296 RepID=UPI0035162957